MSTVPSIAVDTDNGVRVQIDAYLAETQRSATFTFSEKGSSFVITLEKTCDPQSSPSSTTPSSFACTPKPSSDIEVTTTPAVYRRKQANEVMEEQLPVLPPPPAQSGRTRDNYDDIVERTISALVFRVIKMRDLEIQGRGGSVEDLAAQLLKYEESTGYMGTSETPTNGRDITQLKDKFFGK